MASFTYTKTDQFLGTLSNGRKIVQSVVKVADTATDPTIIYPGSTLYGSASPDGALKKVIAFHVTWLNASGTGVLVEFAISSAQNFGGISVTPGASLNGAIFSILAVGE